MLGSVGTGKTLLASAIIENLVDKHNCWIRKVSDIFRDIKETYSKECPYTEANVIDKFTNLPLLIIDEIGVQFNSEAEKYRSIIEKNMEKIVALIWNVFNSEKIKIDLL